MKGLLDELASNSPAPGGGSVAALAGALSASLVAMVARLTGAESGNEAMNRVLGAAVSLRKRLDSRVDEDTAAFDGVMRAYRLPRQTEEEKEKRSGVIQDALKGAAGLPLLVAGECLQALRLCREVVSSGNPNALSDAGVASLMAYSGITGAMFNVAVNLEGIRDREFVEQAAAEKDRIMSEAKSLYIDIRGLLEDKMPYAAQW